MGTRGMYAAAVAAALKLCSSDVALLEFPRGLLVEGSWVRDGGRVVGK